MEKTMHSNSTLTSGNNSALVIRNIATMISSTVTVMCSRKKVRIASK